MSNKYRPGIGWESLGSGVYEYTDGRRVSLLGMCRMPDRTFIRASDFGQFLQADRMIQINGGNRKRGMMAWALTL